MSISRVVFVFALFSFSTQTFAQQASTSTPVVQASDPQAITLLQKSLAALSGGNSISDVTLSGTAERIAGSDDEMGTVVLKALATGESRLDLTMPSGPRSEVQTNSPSGPVGSWSGADGTSHAISQDNLWSDFSWFFPAFTLARVLGDSSYLVSYVGHETRNDQAVEHLTVSRHVQATGAPTGWTSSLPALSRSDIYLDSATLLPGSVVFNTHPDKNQKINIPVEIRLTNYQRTNGVLVPLRIQQHLNNGLALDLQLTVVTPNSGLSVSTFNVQ